LQWVSPKQFGVPDSEVVYRQRSWDLAIKLMKCMPRMKTPSDKWQCIIKVMNLLQLSYKISFGHRKEKLAATDDLFPSLIYIIC